MKRYVTIFLLGMIIIFGAGCSNTTKGINLVQETNNSNMTTSQKVSKKYIENKGYKIVSYDGIFEKYVLTKEKIIQEPYIEEWAVQCFDPKKYLLKKITVEKFTVQNHPLDEWTPLSHFVDIQSTGKTAIYVFMVDNKAIGGYSRPAVKEGKNKLGKEMVWSVDGKHFPDLNPHLNFEQWKKSWQEKFA
ncbi:hypothetical protein Dtox_2752 [Desulfofarcimen acetoxidans DSM 771]|uniref:DUF4830 domain-containing protein n=1 Tax=Desulfofarcimen acetoxidans (strain ATCC 49208 / DSM 771 / KCTC 5769 / VKM B-1644 / 5575) TaxID=485916 RepID=C8W1Q9_DESAS|nr:hypothetical protein [Desulfofarcimen acetoxidans]ACV63530.1 hypothetical protein Dtox_2752 [Desulfofarcimen acetoxidans DSM 771]